MSDNALAQGSAAVNDRPGTGLGTGLGLALLAVTVLLALPDGLGAQKLSRITKEGRYWVQTEVGSVPAGGRLQVSSVEAIKITGGAGSEFRYRVVKRVKAGNAEEAEQLLAAARVAASRRGITAVISQEAPSCFRCGFRAEMDIQAPQRTGNVLVTSAGGALTVNDIHGRVTAETAGGAIQMSRISRDVRAMTAGGKITLSAVGGTARCETAGGSIDVADIGGDAVLASSGGAMTATRVKGMLQAETAGGSISADEVDGKVVAGTSGGSIHLERVLGVVTAETAGGSIHVGSAPRGIRAEAAGGSIHLREVAGSVRAAVAAGNIEAYLAQNGLLADSLLETTAGKIIVWIPADLAVTIRATIDLANSLNRIETDFGGIQVRRAGEGFGPGRLSATGDLNGGGPELRLVNVSGRIQIRRLPQ